MLNVAFDTLVDKHLGEVTVVINVEVCSTFECVVECLLIVVEVEVELGEKYGCQLLILELWITEEALTT